MIGHQLEQGIPIRLCVQCGGEALVHAQNALFLLFTQQGIKVHVLVTRSDLAALSI